MLFVGFSSGARDPKEHRSEVPSGATAWPNLLQNDWYLDGFFQPFHTHTTWAAYCSLSAICEVMLKMVMYQHKMKMAPRQKF